MCSIPFWQSNTYTKWLGYVSHMPLSVAISHSFVKAITFNMTGSILESKGMRAIFQKKGKKKGKKGKIIENWGKNIQNLKIFWNWKYFDKGQPHASNYHMHEITISTGKLSHLTLRSTKKLMSAKFSCSQKGSKYKATPCWNK